MTKRYREQLDEVELDAGASGVTTPDAPPAAFRWRGRRYRVTSVLGHWYEDEGWWRRTDGLPERIERTDLWRVEANGGSVAASSRGVYELVHRAGSWRLDRIWD